MGLLSLWGGYRFSMDAFFGLKRSYCSTRCLNTELFDQLQQIHPSIALALSATIVRNPEISSEVR